MNNRNLGRFFKFLLITLALVMLVIAVGTYMAHLVNKSNISTQVKSSDFSNTGKKNKEGEVNEFENKTLTTVAVFGTVGGDDVKTDVNMLVFFNHESHNIDVVSIPEDTRMKIPDEVFERISSNRSGVEQIVKINDVPTFVDKDRNETSVAVIEKSLGVNIDYYVNLDLEAFRKAVDSVGEITLDLPMDMEYTDNSEQIFINLKKGENKLNGAQAEQLVRFISGYDNKEIGRIKMQQNFMKSFVGVLLNTKNRVNMVNIIAEVLPYLKTNFTNVADYLIFLDKVTEDNFRFHVLPGHQETTKRGYYIYELEKTKSLIGKIINNEEIEPEIIIDVKSLAISVQNGTNIKGFAGRTGKKLKESGYKVEEITNYTENNIKRSKIIVENELVFEDLAPYFKNPEMVINEDLKNQKYQVIIVLGEEDGDK